MSKPLLTNCRSTEAGVSQLSAIGRPNADSERTALGVTSVVVNLSHLSDAQGVEWESIDWRKFLIQVSFLHVIRIVLGFRSRNHMLAFENNAVDALIPPISPDTSRIVDSSIPPSFPDASFRYALLHKYGWSKASRDSEVQQGCSLSFLRRVFVNLQLRMNRATKQAFRGPIRRLGLEALRFAKDPVRVDS